MKKSNQSVLLCKGMDDVGRQSRSLLVAEWVGWTKLLGVKKLRVRDSSSTILAFAERKISFPNPVT